MLLHELAVGDNHTVRIKPGLADLQHPGTDPFLECVVRLAGRIGLGDPVGILDEVGHIPGRRPDPDLTQRVFLLEIQQPGRTDLHGDVPILQIGKGLHRRILTHHDSLRIMLEVGVHRDHRQAPFHGHKNGITADNPQAERIQRYPLLDLGIGPPNQDPDGHPFGLPKAQSVCGVIPPVFRFGDPVVDEVENRFRGSRRGRWRSGLLRGTTYPQQEDR